MEVHRYEFYSPTGTSSTTTSTKLGTLKTLTRQIINGLASTASAWVVVLMRRQANLLIVQSAADLRMAKEVSKMLSSYDTVGALAYLSAHEQSEDAGDAGLVAVLKEIAQNLDKYRPHIPNYIKGDDADGSQSCI